MDSYDYLHKRALTTSKARYEASKRLRLHNWCSQWTLAFLAVGQIFLALLITLDLISSKDIPKNLLEMGGIFFAVVVLAYSLLLGMGDFSARSSNMHQCGLQLGELARKLKYKIDHSLSSTEQDYLSFTNEYYVCLNRHENHVAQDYLIAKLDYLNESNSSRNCLFKDFVNFKIKIYLYMLLSFCHYFVSIAIMICWFMYILL